MGQIKIAFSSNNTWIKGANPTRKAERQIAIANTELKRIQAMVKALKK